jgi:hypothetical protein
MVGGGYGGSRLPTVARHLPRSRYH